MAVLPRQDAQPVSPSSSSTGSATSSTSSSTDGGGQYVAGSGSTSLYLFTFLITIVVLALISGALVLRAYVLRRRFRRRVEEAIRTGNPLPMDAAAALGLLPRRGSRKKEEKVAVMPTMWEGEMRRDVEKGWDEEDDLLNKGRDQWDGMIPVAVTHFPPPPPPPPPPPQTLPPILPQPPSLWRQMFTSSSSAVPSEQSLRPALNSTASSRSVPNMPKVVPSWSAPDTGEEVVVGVMIAMPCLESGEELWEAVEEGEERDMPEVSFGIMSARIGGV
ncbi:hypothetical protein L198_07252 [Cryptococcus wingfieldii CBS 7118]|uniref:Uncharacterized protein n=1 Tax=Cryptococcus wingfieldii CBS 7118 TaxID=1295528 RepID=A0A1E3IDH1_9TREE|nr:hypothetical protein L198_07252 [Cryptococcus wingfieldii CBS 7118]ODN86558.1 hypothetical protein L198_07252 [Cryptococcus wingfieldii CBS 7118]